MKKLFAIAAVAAIGALGATSASAITVGGTSTGTFNNENADNTLFPPAFGTFGAEISADGKQLSWPGEDCALGFCADLGGESTLTISDGAFSEELPTGSGSVDLFSLTWYNASTWDAITDDVFQAFANFVVAFTQPGGGGGSEDVTFTITNTDNPLGDTIAAALSVGPLDFGGVPLDLGDGVTVTGYSLSQSGAGGYGASECGASGIWCNPEHGTSVLTISADIDVSAVPLPAAAWMLLASMGGLAAVARRKKAA